MPLRESLKDLRRTQRSMEQERRVLLSQQQLGQFPRSVLELIFLSVPQTMLPCASVKTLKGQIRSG